ncbi:ATP-binding protein [Croceibacter atlanticus]|uniref:ATP-binding protein n=1 Tax=Croceibacter atlanticus TaxID=313588 RepID=UPI0030F598D8
MAKQNELHFKISTGLKDLLGQDLITNEFIAVFELVKNSFDAHSKEVYIVFEELNTPNAKIKIIDTGKGMSRTDLINKWLFVAYSAKRDGTEDKKNDYRENLKSNRYYAGAKGVGRFSCDRLGKSLTLFSKSNQKHSKIEKLEVDWSFFELDSKKLFKDIPVKSNVVSNFPAEYSKYKINNGTILEISNLRDIWNREKILDLKSSLAKLILPKFNEEKDDSFKIIVESKDEIDSDQEYISNCNKEGIEPDPKNIVNGPVENFIFETLNLKTTQIQSSVSNDGLLLTTKLIDRGEFIYEVQEENSFNLLENISIQMFFLNRAAKWNFTHKMNTEVVNYGNLFMYKNGFRIHPYGNPRDDSYGIDARKAQGYSRHLGTREIIGKIEINGENPALRETTSRDGGLIKNSSFEQLLDYIKVVLVRLEKYVVDAKNWGVDDEDLKDLQSDDSNTGIVKLLSNISNDSKIKNIKYNDNIADILDIHEERSAKKLLKNFKRIASESNDTDLERKANELEKKLNSLQKAKKEAETQRDKEKEEYQKREEKLKKTNKYLLSVGKELSTEAIGLVHHISHKLSQTTPQLDSLIRSISRDKFDKKTILKKLSDIKLNTEQVEKISRLVIRSNFDLLVSEEQSDLITYIEEYVSLHQEINELTGIEIQIEKEIEEFIFLFSKINISLIIDDLISNAKKANATKAKITFSSGPKKSLQMIFSDNGKGVNKEIESSMFEIGITSTIGSGVGLFTIKKLMKEMGGSAKFIGNDVILSGANFQLTF